MICTEVFDFNVLAYDKDPTIPIINQGGTSSSKTYSILQFLYFIASNSAKPLVISICSYALPHLRLGAVRDFENILNDEGVAIEKIRNKTENTYYIGKSIIEFFGTDNVAKVKGPRRDILYINECNYVKYDIYDQLSVRTKGAIFLDFNPTLEFWVHTELIPNSAHHFIKSTYLNNRMLDEVIVKRIESHKNNEQWWRVYGLGETGSLEGAIFKNWRFENDSEVSEQFNILPSGYAMDFGFHPDPDVLVKVAVDEKRKKIYAKQIIHQSGLGLEELTDLIGDEVTSRSQSIVADSATPRMIYDLSKRFNIKGVVKGGGSIIEGIRIMQDYEIIISKDSYDLSKELNSYMWSDKKAGIPLDANNHEIDSIRYYVLTHTNHRRRTKLIS